MEIKVLGTGCAKCKTTQQIVEKVVADNGVDAQISKVEDIMDIMNYNVIATPAVVVDGVVKIKGRVPSESEVKQALGL
ncbi:MAG: thioredoxin family protein [Bacteroidales bacterium]